MRFTFPNYLDNLNRTISIYLNTAYNNWPRYEALENNHGVWGIYSDGLSGGLSGSLSQRLVFRSIVLHWIYIYRNWSISKALLMDENKSKTHCNFFLTYLGKFKRIKKWTGPEADFVLMVDWVRNMLGENVTCANPMAHFEKIWKRWAGCETIFPWIFRF